MWKRKSCVILLIFLFFLSPRYLSASPVDSDKIPSSLQEWKPWVLHGMEKHFCPTLYNNGESFQCSWPSRLMLEVHDSGCRFNQEWLVFVASWVRLPGSSRFWPAKVSVDGKPGPVIGSRNIPLVHLKPGKHIIKGELTWEKMPELIHVPPQSGLVSISINGKSLKPPLWDDTGRLWLKQERKKRAAEKQVVVRIYRLLDDTIPMKVLNLIRIDVSGQGREIKLENILLKNTVPMNIESVLPIRFGPGKELIIQGRAGHWKIRIETRLKGHIDKIKPRYITGKEEIWSFKSENDFRMVKIEGVAFIDPTQTDVPKEWQKYPTFVMRQGSGVIFKEIRRGDPDPSPDRLNLRRTLWLDFDGKGFSVLDKMTGTMSRHWYLAMNPPGILGRVSIDGKDQLITTHGKENKPGVELRKGQLDLSSESRLEGAIRAIPAVGWDHNFQSVSGVLNLPPGWKLLTARGVDVTNGTWFEKWTLLDLFIVLIISLAIWKLWDFRWGILALVTIGITYHEPGAPQMTWVNFLAAVALLRFLPESWVKNLVHLWKWGVVVFLLILVIPFMIQQIRFGIYPQLEAHGYVREIPVARNISKRAERLKRRVKKSGRSYDYNSRRKAVFGISPVPEDKYPAEAILAQDPNALIQTGPGLPSWKWRSVKLKWNGPVEKDQQVHLWLLSPPVNFALAFLRVGLLAFLIIGITDLRPWKIPRITLTAISLVIILLLCGLMPLANAQTVGYPPPELLEQFQKRLLEKADCYPQCADSPQMHVTADLENIRILFRVHAAVETAVPLPGSLKSWVPEEVLVDSKKARGLLRDDNGLLWLLAPEGIHTVTLIGNAPPGDSFQVQLPLRPRNVTLETGSWKVQGIGKDGHVQSSILLTRIKKNGGENRVTGPPRIQPFYHVTRILSLGLDWKVVTTIQRLTPKGTPEMLYVPLVDGEEVTTPGISMENGHALINMGPETTSVRWDSVLKKSTIIHMTAPKSVPWTETWALDTSPIWHCEISGIPVIHHQNRAGYWKPQWCPWPGERVTIKVSRPKPISGKVLTIDGAKLELTPGMRFTKASLSLMIRTAKGGQHKVTLPGGSRLMQVQINGKSQPIKLEKSSVFIPLQPGSQDLTIEWHQTSALSFFTQAPSVKIGADAVNADISFKIPRNRWILWAGGPRFGPAVLFWSYLTVVVLVALGLGRIGVTPLKTHQWFLLGLGLTQVEPLMSIVIVGWLISLGIRGEKPLAGKAFWFNLFQLILVIWTVVALACLYLSVQRGLLGIPDMQISGNNSSEFLLHWTQDRISFQMPQPWFLSFPLSVFRGLMLAWALWLAYSLLNWLRWGWRCFGEGGLWEKVPIRRGKRTSAPPPAPPLEKIEE